MTYDQLVASKEKEIAPRRIEISRLLQEIEDIQLSFIVEVNNRKSLCTHKHSSDHGVIYLCDHCGTITKTSITHQHD